MGESINFTVNDILGYQNAVENALEQVYEIERQVDYRANEELRKAEELLKHVNYVLDTMDADRKTAWEVKEHDETVLSRLKQHLTDLQAQASQLQSAHSDAAESYKAAAAEETRIRNISVPSTGDSATDQRMQQMRSQKLAGARADVQQASAALSRIEQQQNAVNREIGNTQSAIETVRRYIEELDRFIRRIQQEIEEVARYRDRLNSDMQQLQWEFNSFSLSSTDIQNRLRECTDLANRAAEHGRNICSYLDLDMGSSGDYTQITFHDLHALPLFAKDLETLCRRYEDTQDDVFRKAKYYGQIMEDDVIRETTAILREECFHCEDTVGKLKDAAKRCQKAGAELRAYYDLKQFW